MPVLGSTAGAADLIFTNGRVYTVDEHFSVAEAVSVRDGKIHRLGSAKDMLAAAGPDTRVVDLRGGSLLPGFVDAHAHMDREGLKYVCPSLAGARSIEDILAVIRAAASKTPCGGWIVTMPVGEPPFYQNVPGCLREGRLPDRHDLDRAAPDHPVFIRGIWGHWNRPPIFSIANSRALAEAGITRDTLPPYDGIEIGRDADGEPNGVFTEHEFVPALEFTLMSVVPRFDHATRLAAMRESLARYHAAGVTSACEGHGVADEVLRVFRESRAAGALSVRSNLVVSPPAGIAVSPDLESMMAAGAFGGDGLAPGDDWLRVAGIYAQLGGNPDVARLLARAAPYTGWGSYYYDAADSARFRDTVFAAARHGVRVFTIASSESAVAETLAVFEEAHRRYDIAARRWVMSHLYMLGAAHLEAMRRLGVVASAIPATSVWKNGALRLAQLAPDARARFAPYRAIVEAGVPLCLATDNAPPRPFFILWNVIARSGVKAEAIVPAQALTREQALRAMTLSGAWLTFEEDAKGSIEPGKYADLVAIDTDWLGMPEGAIRDLVPAMTVVGGRVVFER